jgi:hypothetical protein
MAKLTLAEELDAAIRMAAREADSSFSNWQIAEKLYDSQPELMAQFTRDWVIEKLASLLRGHRAAERKASDPQLTLGFALPRSIVLKDGNKVPAEDATLGKLTQYRAQIRKRRPRLLESIDKAIVVMRKYARKKRGITWGEVVTLESAKKVGAVKA